MEDDIKKAEEGDRAARKRVDAARLDSLQKKQVRQQLCWSFLFGLVTVICIIAFVCKTVLEKVTDDLPMFAVFVPMAFFSFLTFYSFNPAHSPSLPSAVFPILIHVLPVPCPQAMRRRRHAEFFVRVAESTSDADAAIGLDVEMLHKDLMARAKRELVMKVALQTIRDDADASQQARQVSECGALLRCWCLVLNILTV